MTSAARRLPIQGSTSGVVQQGVANGVAGKGRWPVQKDACGLAILGLQYVDGTNQGRVWHTRQGGEMGGRGCYPVHLPREHSACGLWVPALGVVTVWHVPGRCSVRTGSHGMLW